MSIRSNLKAILGNQLTYKLAPYLHGLKGQLASWRYGNPASKMILVGITGTKGKTTTTMQLGRMLNLSGVKTGYLSTGSIYLGDIDNKDIMQLQQLKKAFSQENLEKLRTQNKNS